MKSDPYTINIYVPEGDPEGIRIISHMNWAGCSVIFPRDKWPETKQRSEFSKAGVYILGGYKEDDDLQNLYIGQSDFLLDRLEIHYKQKDFWDWAIIFISPSDALNQAHVKWLEYMLVRLAKKAQRCHLENNNVPQEPSLTEAEKANTQIFLKEMLRILPLVDIRAFEMPKPVATPRVKDTNTFTQTKTLKSSPSLDNKDTVIVPAQKEGFERVFLGEDSWYAIRIARNMLDKIKYIAAYQTAPKSAITHIAPVDRIEPYGNTGKYKLIFGEKARKINDIKLTGKSMGCSMQSPRYTTLDRLLHTNKFTDLFDKCDI
jgi:hypothetical protein